MRVLKKKLRNFCQRLSQKNKFFRWVFRSVESAHKKSRYKRYAKKYKVDDKTMLFTAFQGRQYACSPRAIYEALLKDPYYDDYTFIWAFKRPAVAEKFEALQRAVIIRYGSKEMLRAFATAKYWISNLRIFPEISKKPEQIYVQTWHGSPFKRLGYDLEVETKNALYTNKEFEAIYSNDAKKFDFMVTQSPFCTEKISSGFNLPGCDRTHTLLETGYPRNDFLINHTVYDVRRAKQRLRIPEGKKVILYAPTWRDDQHTIGLGFTYKIGEEFDYLYEHLSEDYIILFRAHYFVANAFDFEKYDGFVRNVSKVHDINNLYIISDMLITDYSSAFFDYANLNRPILFYMYDRKNYAENLRGFWLSFDELPGPVVEDIQSLTENIRNIDAIHAEYHDIYQAFNARCNALDDGHAAERVIKAFTGRSLTPAAEGTGIVLTEMSFDCLRAEDCLRLQKARSLGKFLIVCLPKEHFDDRLVLFEAVKYVDMLLPLEAEADFAALIGQYKVETFIPSGARGELTAALSGLCRVVAAEELLTLPDNAEDIHG